MANQYSTQDLLNALKGYEDESPEYSSLADLINRKSPPVVAEPSNEPAPDYEKLLNDAKAKRDDNTLSANLSKAGAMANQALSGTKVDTSVYDDLAKQAGQSVDDVKLLQQTRNNKLDEDKKIRENNLGKEAADPNSSISGAARERLKKAMPEIGGMKGFDKLSAAQLENLGFKIGNLSQSSSFQQTRYVDPATGEVKLGLFNTKTGEIVDTGRNAGFANQFREDPNTGNIIALSPSAPKTNPIGITGPKALPTNQQNGGQAPDSHQIRESLTPKQKDSVKDNTNLYLKDTEKNRDAVVSASNVRRLLSAPSDGKMDYDILRAIQNQLARGNGEVGAMTENDVAPYGGKPTLMGKIERFMQMQSVGQLPPEDRKLLSDLSHIMENNARTGIKMQAQPYVSIVQRDTGLDPESSFKMLGGEATTVPAMSQPSAAPNSSGMTQEQRLKRIQELKAKLGH